MSKKKKQIDLGKLMKESGAQDTLPKGPSGRPQRGRFEREERGGYGRRDGGFGSKADEDEGPWRRGGGGGTGGDEPRRDDRQGGFNRRDDRREDRFRDDRSGGGDDEGPWRRGRADEDEGPWRRGGSDDRAPPPAPAADGDDNWRRNAAPPPRTERRDQQHSSNDDGDWRSSRISPRGGPKPAGEADTADTWRRGGAPPSNENASDWRTPRGVESPAAPDDDSGRPRLKLKKKGVAEDNENEDDKKETTKESNEDDDKKSTGSSNDKKDDNLGPDGKPMNKWDKILARASSSENRRIYGSESDREREREFSRFNPPRTRPGAEAFGGGRRGGGRQQDDDYQRASQIFGGGNRRGPPEPRRFPGSDNRGPREPRQFPGSYGQRDRDHEREDGGYENEDRSYRGGMERVNRTNKQRETPGSPSRRAAQAGNWGDSDDEKATKAKEKKKLTGEEFDARSEGLLRTFMKLQDKKTVVSSMRDWDCGDSLPNFIYKAVSKTFDGTSLECQLISGLIEYLVADKILSEEDVVKGLERSKEKIGDDKEKSSQLKTVWSSLERAKVVPEKSEGSSNTEDDAGVEEKGEEVLQKDPTVDLVLSSGKKAKEAADMVDLSKIQSNFGAQFLESLLTPEVVKDEKIKWLSQEEYMPLLRKVLYEEEPEDEKLKSQLKALYAVQASFNAIQFPKDGSGQAIIEKVFMSLYDNDVVPPEAIIAWKDDLSETPGKTKAMIQLAQFVNWLEEESEDEEEEEAPPA